MSGFKISKFDFQSFSLDEEISPRAFAVSMQRYTRDEAVALAKREFSYPSEPLMIAESHVTHRAGVNEDGEPWVGWWLDYKPYKRSCPIWLFRRGNRPGDFYPESYTEVV